MLNTMAALSSNANETTNCGGVHLSPPWTLPSAICGHLLIIGHLRLFRDDSGAEDDSEVRYDERRLFGICFIGKTVHWGICVAAVPLSCSSWWFVNYSLCKRLDSANMLNTWIEEERRKRWDKLTRRIDARVTQHRNRNEVRIQQTDNVQRRMFQRICL